MNRKILWLVATLGAMATLLSGISCGDDDNGTPDGGGDVADEGGGGDVTDEGGGGACPPTAIAGGTSTMRLRRLNVTAPTAMVNAILQQLIDTSMDNEDFIWLMTFTGIGTGSIALQTGSGQAAAAAATYSYLPDPYPPDSMDMLESALAFTLSGDPINRLDVPMWSEGTAFPDAPLLVLPLRELDISGTFSDDHLFVGSWDEFADAWIDGGVLQGKVTVTDAKATIIDVLGMSLCGLISGNRGSDPSGDCDPADRPWTNEPDTTVDGEDAYNLSGTIAASPVCID